jgi:hypothetical protein
VRCVRGDRLFQFKQHFELGRRCLRGLGHAAHDLQAQGGGRQGLQQRLGGKLRMGAAFGRAQVVLADDFLEQELRQRHGFADLLLEGRGPISRT